MNRIALFAGALALVAAAGPSYALDDDVELHPACTAPAGATVLVPAGKGFDAVVPTPVGVPFQGSTEDAASFVVDLAGLPVDTAASLAMTLSWDNPVGDYDLVVDGTNDLSTDFPETKAVEVVHCTPVDVDVEVFIGLPVDEVVLAAEALTDEE